MEYPAIFRSFARYPALRLLLVCTVITGYGVDAQSPVFPEARMEELRDEIAYVPPVTEPVEESKPLDWSFFGDFDFENARWLWILFLSLVVLTGLGFFIYRLVGGLETRRKRKSAAPAATPIVAEDIVEEELVESGVPTSLLEQAEAAGQYDIAVRLLYIKLLKLLNDRGLIKYRKDFSNRDYRRQLANGPYRDDFRAITQEYERYWYGKYRIDRLSYRLFYQQFNALEAKLPVTEEAKAD